MRTRITRALTAALAIAGAIGAIVLPTLSLGPARAPTHAFSLPAPTERIVIQAAPIPPVAVPRALDRLRATDAVTRPAERTAVVVEPTRKAVPAPTARPAVPKAPQASRAPAPRPLPAANPAPAPAPAPAPTPQPQPLPPAEPATAPAPSAVRLVTSYTPPAVQPTEADGKKHKPRKDKREKQENAVRQKAKHEQAPKPSAEPVVAAPVEPVAPEPTTPTEPVSSAELVQHEAAPDDDHGKSKGGHGKGHDKRK